MNFTLHACRQILQARNTHFWNLIFENFEIWVQVEVSFETGAFQDDIMCPRECASWLRIIWFLIRWFNVMTSPCSLGLKIYFDQKLTFSRIFVGHKEVVIVKRTAPGSVPMCIVAWEKLASSKLRWGRFRVLKCWRNWWNFEIKNKMHVFEWEPMMFKTVVNHGKCCYGVGFHAACVSGLDVVGDAFLLESTWSDSKMHASWMMTSSTINYVVMMCTYIRWEMQL